MNNIHPINVLSLLFSFSILNHGLMIKYPFKVHQSNFICQQLGTRHDQEFFSEVQFKAPSIFSKTTYCITFYFHQFQLNIFVIHQQRNITFLQLSWVNMIKSLISKLNKIKIDSSKLILFCNKSYEVNLIQLNATFDILEH